MIDESMPGAAQEAPETFRILAAPLWPRLPLAAGYPGTARWVALYLSGDQAMYYDGDGTGTGDTGLLLAFKRHPLLAPHVAGAHLGSGAEEASEWLLVDRQDHALYLVESHEARRFLAEQWPRYEQPVEYTEAELARLLEEGQGLAVLPDWVEQLAETVRESRANYALMVRWLDQQSAEER